MVDLTGVEPVISAMRMRRITNCATGPNFDSALLFLLLALPTIRSAARRANLGGHCHF